MFGPTLQLFWAFFVCLAGVINADTKVWTKNTNFEDPANWNGGGVLCSNDRKRFPADMTGSIFIQKNESLQELVLSNNIVLTFGKDVVITFADSPSVVSSPKSQNSISTIDRPSVEPPAASECTAKGRVLEFQATASSWFDPHSWNTTSSRNDSQKFVLDLERVPCSKDQVVFPPENNFQVDMEGQALNSGTINIRKDELKSQEVFDKYWGSNQARYDFVNSTSSNTITGDVCEPDKQCACPDRYTDKATAQVCKYMKSSDSRPACSKPIPPSFGQCNPLCGATMDMAFNLTDPADLSFLWGDIKSAVLTVLSKMPAVLYAIGPFTDGVTQITLIDKKGDGVQASRSVCRILDQLKFNSTAYIQGITRITFERSVGPSTIESCAIQPSLAPQTKTGGIDYVILGVALGIGVIFIILVAAGIAIYRRRFQGNMKTELEMGDINNGNRLTSQGFDNPVYNSPVPFDDSFVINYDTDNDQITGFENATYVPDPAAKQKTKLPEKKVPLDDPGEPAQPKKLKTKAKKSKDKGSIGFDNPVYDIKGKQNGDNMVSVSLEDDGVVIPDKVEHDGVGFINPIATGLSDPQASPESTHNLVRKKESKGITNPLYESPTASQETMADESIASHEITVQPATQTSKKKAKKNKKPKAMAADDGDLGFGNPMYGTDNSMDFYQPGSGGNATDFLPAED